jgi:hypothetical protein
MIWIIAAIAGSIYLLWPISGERPRDYPEQGMTEAEVIAYCAEKQVIFDRETTKHEARVHASIADGTFSIGSGEWD